MSAAFQNPAVLILSIALAAAAVLFALLWRGAAGRHAAAQAALQGAEAAHGRAAAEAAAATAAHERALAQLAEAVQARDTAAAAREAAALRAGQLDTRAEALAAQLADQSAERLAEREAMTATIERLRTGEAIAARALAEARLAAQKDAEASAREIATLRELRQEMTDQFRLLADQTLQTTGSQIQSRHTEQLSALLTPFREQVATFQTELQNREDQSNRERARLGEQIRLLHERSEQISAEAVSLTRALKGDKQRQGAWGEAILSRLLEDSGLEAGVHYLMQDSRRDEDGKLWRPDVILRLPQQKVLVVDSKVSLNAYAEATEAEDPAQRSAALKRHVAAVRAHVQTLSDKGYSRLDQGSVDYVMMFMPIEGAYAEAVRTDGELVAWAMQRRVAVMTPATLMLALRIVDHIWTVERRESNAEAIATRAGAMYDKFVGFVEAMEAVGASLSKAQAVHGQAMDRLTTGRGNITGQIEKLRKLGARSSKRLSLAHDGASDDSED